MIIVPADEFAFVGVGLFLDGVVDDEYAKFVLFVPFVELAHQWLDHAPQLGGV
jgi:hypothetical protein